MTDVHCHLSAADDRVREFLIGRDFFGIHPWDVGTDPQKVATGKQFVGSVPRIDPAKAGIEWLRARLIEHPKAGVGEIGLDRLKSKQISPIMREIFIKQLKLAQEFQRPVVLHGAKCWGEVVRAVAELGTDPKRTYIFHGFSRSSGLIPEIERLNGFISVGPAVLNSHAVNYREMVRQIPDRLLVLETDRTEQSAAECPGIEQILSEVAQLRGVSDAELERLTDDNADRFVNSR